MGKFSVKVKDSEGQRFLLVASVGRGLAWHAQGPGFHPQQRSGDRPVIPALRRWKQGDLSILFLTHSEFEASLAT